MNAPPVSLSATGVLAVVGVAVAGFVLWKTGGLVGSAAKAAASAAQAVNPLNHDNAIATGVNDAGASVFTDPTAAGKNADGSWNLGSAVYDLFHPGWAQSATQPATPTPATFDEFGNPTN